MDGLLIDSEDIYSLVINTILHEYGRPSMPWSIKAQLQGRPAPQLHSSSWQHITDTKGKNFSTKIQAGKIFHDWAQLPITMEDFREKQAALQKIHFPTTKPLPGVVSLLSTLAKTAQTPCPIHMALATSSTSENYALKAAHLADLFSVFPESRLIRGDNPRIGAGRGKPLPDIYLLALEAINEEIRAANNGEPELKPEECLVFEDSVPGVEAGRRAGMQVVWVPYSGLLEEYCGKEELVLAGLTGEHKDVDVEHAVLEGLEGLGTWRGRGSGKTGEVGDGWAHLLQSLENFPYEKFGIKIQREH
ncbi:HAD superfamily hydrolase [Histoplasma capsulatum var. duboisii H88]|uniref:HAD superfamily hydrolase n=2 Tax=Ajellomyces capsulatus TaxID=5037 RepID=F0UVS2_AJEC8|nr:HAD superfamily hydrolase [Histoplasma capsulatum H143]EGC49999.1 HAD superfamily hydrolase [Histoplasma capsulatum var. duboisii H88]